MSVLFSWANILHQLSYPEWIRDLHPLGWLLFFASIGLAIRPSSVRMFLAVLALRLAYTANWMPMIRGHLFLEGLLALGIVIGLSMELRRLGRVTTLTIDEQEKLFESIAPTLRVTCLLVYAAVVLSKLNSDFIDPQHSAAVQLLFWASDHYPFVPTGPWAQELSIWGTFAFEGGIPILLCFRRTRWFGVLAGLFFHTLLAFLPLRIASFTLTMCLLLFVWLPEDSPRLIYGSFQKVCRACRVQPATLVVLVSFLAGATGLIFAGRNGFNLDMRALDMGMGLWWWQTAIMCAALWSVRKVEHDRAMPLLRVRRWTLRLVVGFVIFNILCPYIGLKTRSALSMHSNLRTERGYWNHLFVPERLRVFRYQDNLVEIIDSDLPDFDYLRQEQMPLPFFELRRWSRLTADDFYVDYRDAMGVTRRFRKRDGVGSDPALMKRRWILDWFLCFNPVGASHDYIPGLAKRIGPARNVVPAYDIPPRVVPNVGRR